MQSNGILEEVMKVYYRMMDALGDVISDKSKKNDGIPLAEYSQIESDQGDYGSGGLWIYGQHRCIKEKTTQSCGIME